MLLEKFVKNKKTFTTHNLNVKCNTLGNVSVGDIYVKDIILNISVKDKCLRQ